MKKKVFLLLIPLFSFTLTSCSKGFEMINEGEHGNVYSGGSTTNPIEKEEFDTFINEVKEKLKSDEYKKYDKKWSNVYLETKSKEKDKPYTTNTSTSLIKDNILLSSEIIVKGNETKKNRIYCDAKDPIKLKMLIDSFKSDDEIKKYITEEDSINDEFKYLSSYYEKASMSYLDYMTYMVANFDMLHTLSRRFNDNLNDNNNYINYYKGDVHVKQNGKDNIYKYFSFNLQHEQVDNRAEIYFTGSYDIAKLNLHYDEKLQGQTVDVYMSLLPYDKNISPLNEKDREIVLPEEALKLIS